MKLDRFARLARACRRLSAVFKAGTLAVAVTVAGCGGGGTTPQTHDGGVRPLSAEFSSRKAVAYSPYRTATSVDGLAAETIPKANIKQDLDLLVAAGFGLIRVFDSSDKVAKQTLEVIRENKLDIKMQLGLYMQSGDDVFNRNEIARGVALAKAYPDIVLAVSVGNETMVSWSFNKIDPQVMRGYLKLVRDQITQPVTTDDNYAFWRDTNATITDVVDFAALHTYPELDTVFVPEPGLFDWRQKNVSESQRAAAMMDAAIGEARYQYQLARTHLDRLGRADIPIVIGETGWNAVDVGALKFRAHPVNQKMYLDRLQAWAAEGRTGAGPKAIFYFEAFDEPWKQGDDKWGLFNVARKARYAVKDFFPAAQWVPGDTSEPATASLSDASAVHWKAPTVNAAVTANRYVIFADTVGASDLREAGLQFDPFVKTFWQTVPDAAPGDTPSALEIDPRPEVWGWGMLYQSRSAVTTNLSNFAKGRLEFSVKTTYPGTIEVALLTDTEEKGAVEAYVQLSNGDHGYCNTGTWCQVSIPVSAFLAKNPNLDLRMVTGRFVIADRYANTGKASGANITTKLTIDAVVWTQ